MDLSEPHSDSLGLPLNLETMIRRGEPEQQAEPQAIRNHTATGGFYAYHGHVPKPKYWLANIDHTSTAINPGAGFIEKIDIDEKYIIFKARKIRKTGKILPDSF